MTDTNREITIVIRADGSAAVTGVKAVDAAMAGLAAKAGQASGELGKAGTTAQAVGETTRRAGKDAEELGRGLGVAEQASRRLGGAMPQAGAATDQFTNAARRATNNARELSEFLGMQLPASASKFIGQWAALSLAANQTLGLFSIGAQAAKSVHEFGAAVAKLEESRQAFRRYAQSQGRDADSIISKLKEVSGGTISEMNLINTASKAMALGVTTNAEDMGELLLIARNRARLFGIETTQAFDLIVTGIGRASPKILDDLGIRIPDSVKKATESMTDARSVALLTRATIEENKHEIQAMGGVVDSAADSFRRLETALAGIKGGLADLAPAAGLVADNLAKVVDGATGLMKIPGLLARFAGMRSAQTGIEYVDAADTEGITDPLYRAWVRSQYLAKLKQETYEKYGSSNTSTQELAELPKRLDILNGGVMQVASRELAQAFVKRVNDEIDSGLSDLVAGLPGFSGVASKDLLGEQKKMASDLASERKKAQGEAEKMAEQEAKLNQTLAASVWEIDHARDSFDQLWNDATKGAALATSRILGVPPAFDAVTKAIQPATIGVSKFIEAIKVDQSKSFLALVKNYLADMAKGGFGIIQTLKEDLYDRSLADADQTAEDNRLNRQAKKIDDMGARWREEAEDAWIGSLERLHDSMRFSVRDAFESGTNDWLSGSDFFQSFGKYLGQQAKQALAAGLTTKIFGTQGGTFDLTGLLLGGVSGGGNRAIGPNDIAVDPAGGTGAGNGLLGNIGGGLLGKLFKDPYSGGKLSWSALGSNVMMGAGIGLLGSKLFGQGGVFGGTVVHGGEAVGQAADINSRVDQAQTERDELLKRLIGVSQETAQGLKDLVFYTAGYTVSKSGDGIFSKKTKTYELDATEANARLEEYSKLASKAAAEAAAHQSQISITAIRDPMAALSTTIADLKGAIAAMGPESATLDPENYFALLLQLEQALASQASNRLARVGNNFSFLVSNPLGAEAMAGAADPMSGGFFKDDGNALSYAKRWAQSWKNSQYSSDAQMQFAEGGPWYTGGEIGARNDILTMMTGITGQAEKSYAQQVSALEAGSDPEKLRAVLEAQLESVTQEMALIGELMASAEEAAKSDMLDIQTKTAAFEAFQQAIQEYYGRKLEARQIEAQLQAEEEAALEASKAEAEQRQADLLSSVFTSIGEISMQNGKEINVIFAGTPEARPKLEELLGIIAGSDPTTAAILRKAIDAAAIPRLRG